MTSASERSAPRRGAFAGRRTTKLRARPAARACTPGFVVARALLSLRHNDNTRSAGHGRDEVHLLLLRRGLRVIIEAHDGSVTGVRGDPDHPANFGRLCTKGATLHLSAQHDARALHPELRRSRATARTRAKLDEALDYAAGRFADVIRADGPDAVGFYISGQLLTEDYYVFNKLARALVGTNNIDTNSRLCMSSAVAGYKLALGADAPPACYADIDPTRICSSSRAPTPHGRTRSSSAGIEDARARNPR